MKICYVLDDTIHRWGGAQTYILNLSEWFMRQGHEVFIITSVNDNVRKREISSKINIIEVSKGRDLKGINFNGSVSPFPGFAKKKLIRKILLENNFDIIHFNYPFSPFLSGRILKEIQKLRDEKSFTIKTFCTFHIHVEENIIPKVGNYLLGFYQSKVVRNIDQFISISKATNEYGKKYLKKSSKYIPIGIPNIEVQKPNNKKLNLLFLSRLEERKGCEDLLKAIKIIKDSGFDLANSLEINIAGDGPERLSLEEFAKREGINAIFHGKVTEEKKSELYTKADIAIFPAKFGESFGIVLIEAMNYACRIIGYANPGYSDTLQEFSKECLVDVGDIKALSQKISEAIQDRGQTKEIGKELKNYFQSKFSLETIGEQIEELYIN